MADTVRGRRMGHVAVTFAAYKVLKKEIAHAPILPQKVAETIVDNLERIVRLSYAIQIVSFYFP